jgi:RecA-family ATPase
VEDGELDIHLVSLIGHDTALHPPFVHGRIAEDAPDTPFYQFLEHHLARLGDDDKFLILDNLGQMYFGDYNDRGQVAIFGSRYVRRLIQKHRTTILTLAHPSTSQVQNGEGGAGTPAWSNSVRAHLYFDWFRDGKNGEAGRPIGDTRILSRKKSSFAPEHRPGEGLFLKRGADWTFSIAEKPKTPETPKAKQKRETAAKTAAEDTDTAFVVRKSAIELLEGMVGKVWATDAAFARHLAPYMADQGNAGCNSETLWKKHLPAVRDVGGFPHWHRGQGWSCKTKSTSGKEAAQ